MSKRIASLFIVFLMVFSLLIPTERTAAVQADLEISIKSDKEKVAPGEEFTLTATLGKVKDLGSIVFLIRFPADQSILPDVEYLEPDNLAKRPDESEEAYKARVKAYNTQLLAEEARNAGIGTEDKDKYQFQVLMCNSPGKTVDGQQQVTFTAALGNYSNENSLDVLTVKCKVADNAQPGAIEFPIIQNIQSLNVNDEYITTTTGSTTVTVTEKPVEPTEDQKKLAEAIAQADKILENQDIVNSWKAWKAFSDVLENAKQVSANSSATSEMISGAISKLDEAKKTLIDMNKVWTHSLTLEDTIGLNYFITFDAATRNNPKAYVEFTCEGNKTRIPVKDAPTKKVTEGGIECYRFMVKVFAKQMASTITAKLFADEKDTNPVNLGDYAVRDSLKDVASSPNAALKSLIDKMVNYGAYAQLYFKHHTDDLAKPVEPVSAVDIPAEHQRIVEEKVTDNITYRSSKLLLESGIDLRIIFDVKNTGIEESKLTAVGGEIVKVSDNQYYVRIPNIKAKELDKMQDVIVSYDGVEQFRIRESALSYMRRAIDGSKDESLKNLLKSLYQYHLEGKKYFTPKTSK